MCVLLCSHVCTTCGTYTCACLLVLIGVPCAHAFTHLRACVCMLASVLRGRPEPQCPCGWTGRELWPPSLPRGVRAASLQAGDAARGVAPGRPGAGHRTELELTGLEAASGCEVRARSPSPHPPWAVGALWGFSTLTTGHVSQGLTTSSAAASRGPTRGWLISGSAGLREGPDSETVPDLPCALRHVAPWSRFPHPHSKGGEIGLVGQSAVSPNGWVGLLPSPTVPLRPCQCPESAPNLAGGRGGMLRCLPLSGTAWAQ